jgi:hypothetical protein
MKIRAGYAIGGDAACPFVAAGVVATLMRDATTVGVVMR